MLYKLYNEEKNSLISKKSSYFEFMSYTTSKKASFAYHLVYWFPFNLKTDSYCFLVVSCRKIECTTLIKFHSSSAFYSCSFSMVWNPFDVQKCSIKIQILPRQRKFVE